MSEGRIVSDHRIDPPHEAAPGRQLPPLGLLGMMALIAAIELGVIVPRDLQLTERTTHCWKYAGREARSARITDCDVICVGDSQIKLGVVPTLIESETGRPAFNLAVPGGQAPSSYFLLRRALEAGARPRGVVLGLFPGLLAVDQRMNLASWPELLDTREALDLAFTARDADLFVRITIARLLPSVHKRDVIRSRIAGALQGELNEEYANVLAHLRNWRVNRGGQVTPAREDFRDVVDLAAVAGRTDRSWHPNRVNATYLDRLLALAADHGIRVFWVMPMISPAWQTHREASGLDAGYERFARAQLARHRNLVVVDGRRSGYDPSAFRDQFHLERRGAVALSADLGAILRQLLSSADTGAPRRDSGDDTGLGNRWVMLPAYGERSIHRSLEDVDQSRQALASTSEGRRF